MFENLINISDKWSAISGIIGILGFVISVVNLVYFLLVRKKKLTIRFSTYGVRNYCREKVAIVAYQFDNNSQLPISITRIKLITSVGEYDCSNRIHIAEEFKRTTGGVTTLQKEIYTDHAPINLPSLGSQSGFLAFVIPPNTLSNGEKALTFRIYTNRGKAVQKTFALFEDIQIR